MIKQLGPAPYCARYNHSNYDPMSAKYEQEIQFLRTKQYSADRQIRYYILTSQLTEQLRAKAAAYDLLLRDHQHLQKQRDSDRAWFDNKHS